MQYCGNISSTKSKRNSVKNNAMNSFYLSAQYVLKKKKNTCYWLRPASTVMGQKGGLHPSQVTSLLLG